MQAIDKKIQFQAKFTNINQDSYEEVLGLYSPLIETDEQRLK
jgi:hypothetical protein